MSNVRHRPFVDKFDTIPTDYKSDEDCSKLHRRRLASWSPVLGGSVWMLVFSFYGLLLLYTHSTSSRYPQAITTKGAQHGQFVEELARQHLDDLAKLGSRSVGSVANEVEAVRYLMGELEKIRVEMDPAVHSLEVDVQTVSGTFSLDFLGQFTSCYENVNNVIAKLSPKTGSNNSLLVNCHYDTSINTTGW